MANYNSQYTGEQIDAAIGMVLDGQVGFTDEAKQALLNCFQNVVWTDEHGQDYYDALSAALYPPANLAYLSCAYTQTITIYDTDSLDDLKPDLIVTAHYTDQSTQTISAYSLSGTLATGTSTITVMYGGKSTTFNVTVTHSDHTYLYKWDFTQSLTDSKQSMTLELSGSATRDSSGLHLTSASDYVELTGLNQSGYCFEIDVAEYDKQGTTHGRFFTIYQSGSATAGFIYHNGGAKWGIYSKATSSWTYSTLTATGLNNKTLTLKLAPNAEDSNKLYMFAYVDGDMIVSGDMSATSTSDAYLGSDNGQSAYNMTVTGLRVYEEV